jgi:rhamnose utilization protein RhaD (predicted bifunctional aldolase and dehydrogenase)
MSSSEMSKLVEISHFYGRNKDYIIAGGGNTSYKNNDYIWVKASGTTLADIDENGFVCLSRKMLKVIRGKNYAKNPSEREAQVKVDLSKATISPKHLRPSVETSMHEIIEYPYVVHTHPCLVNALMCSVNAKILTKEIFGDKAIYIEYTDPGYTLFKKVWEKLIEFKVSFGVSPKIIFLQNHGVFVAADSVGEIKEIYGEIERRLSERVSNNKFDSTLLPKSSEVQKSIYDYCKSKSLQSKGFSSELIHHFLSNEQQLLNISRPFTPDIIVYCKSNYLFLEEETDENLINSEVDAFYQKHGYYPKVILVKSDCMIIVEDSEKNIQTVADVFQDMMKISWLSENFGGPYFMTPDQISFIDNWEVENYRRKVSREEN